MYFELEPLYGSTSILVTVSDKCDRVVFFAYIYIYIYIYIYTYIHTYTHTQSDQKVFVHLMIVL